MHRRHGIRVPTVHLDPNHPGRHKPSQYHPTMQYHDIDGYAPGVKLKRNYGLNEELIFDLNVEYFNVMILVWLVNTEVLMESLARFTRSALRCSKKILT